MAEHSRFAKSLRSPYQRLGVGLMLLVVGLLILGPKGDLLGRHGPIVLQKTWVIGLAMYSCAQDNNGVYPTGRSSTEVFQKLIDGGYVPDPTVFYAEELKVPGKRKAISKRLEPKNVCWDVTIPLDSSSPGSFPVVFSTGYKINYAPRGHALPLFLSSSGRPNGIAVFYVNNSTKWCGRDDGTYGEVSVIDSTLNSDGKTYQQLTPDGPLPP
jgi:hypothetical protein